MDKRRNRRVAIECPLTVKREMVTAAAPSAEEDSIDTLTSNISLGGLYFRTSKWTEVEEDEMVKVSISISRSYLKYIPFSRFIGKARVVRVEKVVKDSLSQEEESGVALKFTDDIMRLAAIEE